MRLEYVGIRVRDLDRAVDFYMKVLGLKERVRGDFRDEGRGIWVGLSDPKSGVKLELNWYPPGSKFATRGPGGIALNHIGFAVPRRDMPRVYRRLRARGARPTGITPGKTENWQAYLLDPEDNWIEIYGVESPRKKIAGRRRVTVRRPSGPRKRR